MGVVVCVPHPGCRRKGGIASDLRMGGGRVDGWTPGKQGRDGAWVGVYLNLPGFRVLRCSMVLHLGANPKLFSFFPSNPRIPLPSPHLNADPLKYILPGFLVRFMESLDH